MPETLHARAHRLYPCARPDALGLTPAGRGAPCRARLCPVGYHLRGRTGPSHTWRRQRLRPRPARGAGVDAPSGDGPQRLLPADGDTATLPSYAPTPNGGQWRAPLVTSATWCWRGSRQSVGRHFQARGFKRGRWSGSCQALAGASVHHRRVDGQRRRALSGWTCASACCRPASTQLP